MFYSQFILAKKGPLGTIWIAAHLERKLRKNQVADTDIGVSVDSIIFPEAPIALRLSSHLLLGVVRIYNRKVNYLFDDCSETLLNVKQAFRSTAVDLPPEESKAPYNSITLPENFDLDDFELPDNDIFKGNYVDHHISSRDQITLQDSMEGVSYSTSKFGLDERFGDDDASGLDLDEELFMNKVEIAGAADESADPQTSYRSTSPLKPNEHPEDIATNSENTAGGVVAEGPSDVMDYAHAPSTPGLVEEPNLSNAKNALACDDHMESEYHIMESTAIENNNNNKNNNAHEDKQEVDWCSQGDTIFDAVHLPLRQHEENGHFSSLSEIKESELQGGFPTKGQDEDKRPTLEFTDKIEASDVPLQEDFPTKVVKEDKSPFLLVDETSNRGLNEVVQEKSDLETYGFAIANTDPQVSYGISAKDQHESYDVGSEVASENQVVKEDKSHFLLVDETSNRCLNEVVQDKSDLETSGFAIANTDPQVSYGISAKDQHKSYDVGSEVASENQVVKEDKPRFLLVDETSNRDLNEVVQEKSDLETSGFAIANTDPQVSYGISAKDQQKSCDVGSEVASGNQVVKEDKPRFLLVDETSNRDLNEVVQEKSDLETSGLAIANTDPQVSYGISAKDQQKSCDVGSEVASGNQVEFFLEALENQASDKEAANVSIISGPCNSVAVNPDVTKLVDCTETAVLEANEREETIEPGKDCIISNSDQIPKENRVQELKSGEDIRVAVEEPDAQVLKTNSQDVLLKKLNNITEHEFPAPEKLLSVPEGLIDSHRDMLAESSQREFQGLGVIGDAGSKSAVDKKRSFTESTLTKQSLNSAESSRQVRAKWTTGSVPGDDDFLSSILAGRNSLVLKVKPTPPLTEATSLKRTRGLTRSGAPKRKILVDDTMVLHGDMIRHQLTNTEDIRRVRKKAPCTLSEISVIQKKHMEDDIFLGTVFSGMAAELKSLHGQTYGLSHITISKEGMNLPSLDTVTETKLSSQDDKNDGSLENIFEPNLASMDGNYFSSPLTMAASHLTSPYNVHHDGEPSEKNVTETNEQMRPDINNPPMSENRFEDVNYNTSIDVDFRQEEQMGPDINNPPTCENRFEDVNYNTSIDVDFRQEEQMGPDINNPLTSENRFEDVNYNTSVDVDFRQEEQTMNEMGPNDYNTMDEMGPNDFTRESLVNAAEVGASVINAATENPPVILEVSPLDLVQTDSMNAFSERIPQVTMDASADVVPDQMVSMHSVELDYYADIGIQTIDRSEVSEKDAQNEVVAKDDGVPDMLRELFQDDTNHGELKYNLENEIRNINTLEEQIEVSGMGEGFVNNGENLNQPEAYQPNMTNDGVSWFDLHDQDDISYSPAGNDTGFLNVDDDDLNEMADDHMPDDDDDTQYADNSGWSSRTRAVSLYLQTAFVKEAERGKNSLSMDSLLTGKSCKEASRMFFETLVLKTRDYIHVDQRNPYDDISIIPRPSLMKSDF